MRNTITGFVRALGTTTDPNSHKHVMQPLWLPWWIWLFAGIAIVAAGWYRRRSTLVLLVLALALGVLFVQWPEHAIWNTRFLPFWLLTWGFLAAMGATELLRMLAGIVEWAYRWIRDGDLQDARARAWAEIATSESADADPELKKDAAWALAERRFNEDPEGWRPPERLAEGEIERRAQRVGAIALAVLVVIGGFFTLNRAWDARNGNPAIAISGWAAWNYSGYESKSTWPQYSGIMTGMTQVADQYGNGRALWEPSSGDPDAINSYGTSLALELLPLFTHGKIDSMEGIYFESSATTSYHFLTVADCSEHPSNPVRGLNYGNVEDDFDLCVRQLQKLGVKYLMLWTNEANAKAKASDQLTRVKVIPGPIPNTSLKAWTVYEVKDSDLVVGMDREPVVAKLHGGKYSKCWNAPNPDPSSSEPVLEGWECTVAPWWMNRDLIDTPFAQTGPKSWAAVDGRNIGAAPDRPIEPAQVSNVKTTVDKISFDVSEIGKPVEVKESYFPNWKVSGAKGPYRLAPNLMVVVPTSHHVTLSYGLTKVDWLGRVITGLGLIGLVLLGLWVGARRFAADPDDDSDAGDGAGDESGDGDSGGGAPEAAGWGNELDGPPTGAEAEGGANGAGADDPGETGDGSDPDPPDRREREPALP